MRSNKIVDKKWNEVLASRYSTAEKAELFKRLFLELQRREEERHDQPLTFATFRRSYGSMAADGRRVRGGETYYSKILKGIEGGETKLGETSIINFLYDWSGYLGLSLDLSASPLRWIAVEKSVLPAAVNRYNCSFIYHYGQYRNGLFTVDQGKMIINTHTNEVFLTTYFLPASRIDNVREQPRVSSVYEGTIDIVDGRGYITFRNKRANDQSLPVGGFTTIHDVRHGVEQISEQGALCTYNSYDPAVGISYLVPYKASRPTIEEVIAAKEIDFGIQYLMHNQRIEPRALHRELTSLSYARQNIKRLEGYLGQYRGWHIEETARGPKLVEVNLEIYNGFRTRYFSSHLMRIVEGSILFNEDNMMQMFFDYKGQGAGYRVRIDLRCDYQDFNRRMAAADTVMAGTYTSTSMPSHIPNGGRIIFFKEETEEWKRELSEYEQSLKPPREYWLDRPKVMEDIHQRYPVLMNFFSGHYDTFLESPLVHENSLMRYRANNQRFYELKAFAGWYIVVRPSSREARALVGVLHVEADTCTVYRYQLNKRQTDMTTLAGQARVHSKTVISFNYERYTVINAGGVEDISSTTRFTTVSYNPKKLDPRKDDFIGLTTRIGTRQKMAAYREYFFPYEEITDIQSFLFEHRNLPDFQHEPRIYRLISALENASEHERCSLFIHQPQNDRNQEVLNSIEST